MSLLKYFHPVKKNDPSSGLPDPSGPLCIKISSPVIEATNAKVRAVRQSQDAQPSVRKKPYCKLSPAQRYEIGKKAAEMGVTSAIWYYKKVPRPVSYRANR